MGAMPGLLWGSWANWRLEQKEKKEAQRAEDRDDEIEDEAEAEDEPILPAIGGIAQAAAEVEEPLLPAAEMEEPLLPVTGVAEPLLADQPIEETVALSPARNIAAEKPAAPKTPKPLNFRSVI